MKNPIAATLFALLLALAVNLYYYATGTDLTVVVTRTLFADLILVLSLVPVYLAIYIRNSGVNLEFVEMIKAGMKPVAMYAFLIAIGTLILFSIYGEALVQSKMAPGILEFNEAVKQGSLTQLEADQRIEGAKQFYSIFTFLPIILLTNLFVGFLSSILAGLLIKK